MMMLAMLALASVQDCGDQASQTAMTMCQKGVADAADAEMNRVWKTVYARMQAADRSYDGPPSKSAGYAKALLTSQRAWLAYRDAQCVIESYEWRGGTMAAFAANQCLAAVTKARTQQLRTIQAWGE